MKIHIIGIGGIGTSTLAIALLNDGHEISGTDLNSSETTQKLLSLGIKVYLGHNKEFIPKDVHYIIYNPAVTNQEEYLYAKSKYPCFLRAEFLAMYIKDKKVIAVIGTHGKTTTTAMLSHILDDWNSFIGGISLNNNSSIRMTPSEYFIIEADESEPSFLHLNPFFTILTNLEEDHLENYNNSFNNLKDSILKLLNNSEKVLTNEPIFSKKEFLYIKDLFDYEIISPYSFKFFYEKNYIGTIDLKVFGEHNIKNAFLAICASLLLDVPFEKIKHNIESFKGVSRRLEVIYKKDAVTIYDDYAHHPTAIKEVFFAVKSLNPDNPIVIIFEPHRISRFKALEKDFATVLKLANQVFVYPLYDAFENDSVSSSLSNFCIENKFTYIEKNFLPFLLQEFHQGSILICSAGSLSLDIRDVLKNNNFLSLSAATAHS